jgi:hypothetical protein
MAEQTQIPQHGLHTTFISLRNPNFRIYFAAQTGSNIGAWIQITAENWLVLQLADSGLVLGITNAHQFWATCVFRPLWGRHCRPVRPPPFANCNAERPGAAGCRNPVGGRY